MKGNPVVFGDFMVHPEYCGLSQYELHRLSLDSRFNFQIATLEEGGHNVLMVYYSGALAYMRMKYRLHVSEAKKGIVPGTEPPKAVRIGRLWVLPLVCYELLFPEDYWQACQNRPDLIIHLVGTPMHSEEQREGWTALQRLLVYVCECPLVCCCGGESGRMNLSGVLRPNDKEGHRDVLSSL